MKLNTKIKEKIMLHSLKKNIKKNPFDVRQIENYQLPIDASSEDTNSYYFSAHDLDGNSLLLRRAERGNNTVEVWFVFIYKKQVYIDKKQLYKVENAPIHVMCVEPEKTWSVTFDGRVNKAKIDKDKVASPIGEPIPVQLSMDFQATSKIFDFTYHLNPKILAKALAKETWDKTFINNMRTNQQRHYEQQGNVDIKIRIDDKEYELKMRAMRDHSFGRRNWSYMDRHIWLMALVEDKESLNVNMVSYPHMKDLRTGYYESDNITSTLEKAPALREFEPNTNIVNNITYDLEMDNGDKFHVEAKKEFEVKFPFDNGAYTIYEGIGTFKVNGKIGRGIIEFGYNGDSNRWI